MTAVRTRPAMRAAGPDAGMGPPRRRPIRSPDLHPPRGATDIAVGRPSRPEVGGRSRLEA